jgi:hypothetical protein
MRDKTHLLILLLLYCLPTTAQPKTSPWLRNLLFEKATPLLRKVMEHPDSFQCQIIYTRIDRDRHNTPHFTNYYFNVDADKYFNPASTVKLPTALVALEKLNGIRSFGIDRNTAMLTDSSFGGQSPVTKDTSAIDGFPSIAQYIRKIFLVSDNDAYNRLYEFDGQQTLNETLWRKGYRNTRIVRRFVGMTEDQNRHTNAIRFEKDGRLLYLQPPAYDTLQFDYSKPEFAGRGHFDKNDSLVMEPFDFTRHNKFPLEDLQQMVQSVVFPESVPQHKRFDLAPDDRAFLLQYMSELPYESRYPNYDTTEFFASYAKFFLYKADSLRPPSYIRIFNKPGWSYGYLTDAAYIVDFKNNVEFMLSANIYVNRDGILNDDKYEYKETGYPFFRDLGKIIYDYELQRKRKHRPDLQAFKLSYERK